MAGFFDADGAEINGENVEGGFGAAIDGAGGAGDEAVRAEIFDEFGEDAECAATAEGPHKDEREEVGRKTDREHDGLERAAEEVNATGGAEHSNGDEDRDEIRDDANGDVEAFFCAFNKFFIDADAAQGGVERKNREDEGDGDEGDGVDDADEDGLMSGFGGERKAEERRKGEAEKDKEEEEEERGEDESAPPLERLKGGGFFEGRFFGRGGLCFRSTPLPGPLLRGRRGRRRAENWKTFKKFRRGHAGDGGAGGGHYGSADDGGRIAGFVGGENGDGGDGDELDGSGVERKESAHGIRGGTGMRIQRFEIFHRAQPERSGGVAEAEHVGGNVHEHGAHGGMLGRHVRKKPPHDGTQCTREDGNEAGAFGQAHGAEPQGHDADERQGGFHHGEVGHLKAFVGDKFEVIIESADNNGEQNKPEPDVIEHWREAIPAAVNVK